MHRKIVISVVVSLLAVLVALPFAAMAAGPEDNIVVTVSLDKTVYLVGEPITATLTVTNTGPEIYTSKGFKDQDFSLLLRFINPAEDLVQATDEEPVPEPTSSDKIYIDNQRFFAEEVELLESGWSTSKPITVFDRYEIGEPGPYKVYGVVPLRLIPDYDLAEDDGQGGTIYWAKLESAVFAGQRSSAPPLDFYIVTDADADTYWWPIADPAVSVHEEPDCNDKDPNINPGAQEIPGNGIDEDCDPSTADAPAPATIILQADIHTVGTGSHPGSTKEPFVGLDIRVYSKAPGSCAKGHGISWHHYPSIWDSCLPANYGMGATGDNGSLTLAMPAGDYIAIGRHEDPVTGEVTFLRSTIGEVGIGETVDKYMQMIIRSNGRKAAGRYTLKSGSQLLIIEPEYIEWSGTQEPYPFIFDSVGDWSVSTSVSPPEGFVADHESLSQEVSSELKAVQFVITDIGSDWVDTLVEHDVTHKGKKEKVKSKIGVKLSKKLAKQKGLTQFGKKIKKEKKD